jgi:hypothetical protein
VTRVLNPLDFASLVTPPQLRGRIFGYFFTLFFAFKFFPPCFKEGTVQPPAERGWLNWLFIFSSTASGFSKTSLFSNLITLIL